MQKERWSANPNANHRRARRLKRHLRDTDGLRWNVCTPLKEHTEGKMYSHIWCCVTLFWDFPARLIGSSEKPRGSGSPAPGCRPFVGPLWKSETRTEAETGSMRYNRPAQQQCVGRYSNVDIRLDTSRIDSRINRLQIP